MKENKRQKQIGNLINCELNAIFQKHNLTMIDGGMVSISKVQITPDYLEVRIFLSLYKIKNTDATIKKIISQTHKIKKDLSGRLRHQLRVIPELKFFRDEALDYVFQMEKIFKSIEESKSKKL